MYTRSNSDLPPSVPKTVYVPLSQNESYKRKIQDDIRGDADKRARMDSNSALDNHRRSPIHTHNRDTKRLSRDRDVPDFKPRPRPLPPGYLCHRCYKPNHHISEVILCMFTFPHVYSKC